MEYTHVGQLDKTILKRYGFNGSLGNFLHTYYCHKGAVMTTRVWSDSGESVGWPGFVSLFLLCFLLFFFFIFVTYPFFANYSGYKNIDEHVKMVTLKGK